MDNGFNLVIHAGFGLGGRNYVEMKLFVREYQVPQDTLPRFDTKESEKRF